MSWIVPTAHAARPPGRSALARTLRCLPLGLGPSTSQSPSWPVAAGVSGTSHISTQATNNRSKGSHQNSTNRKGASVLEAKKQQRSQKKTPSKPALLRLDPNRPLIPSLTSATSANGSSGSLNLKQQRAKKLAQLHVAFQTGSADAVWSAYLDLQQNHRTRNTYSNSYDTASDNALTPKEFRTVFNIVSNDAARTKRGVNRILRLMSDIRGQQRHLLTQLQHAHDANESARGRLLKSELEAWDKVVSLELLNWTVAHIGRSLRSVGLEEIDQVLDQLLMYEANEQSRRSADAHDSLTSKPTRPPLSTTSALDDLRTAILSPVVRSALSKKRGTQRQPDFPDISIYNTILDIITRTIRRSSNIRRSASSGPQAYDEDEEDVMSKFTEQQRESHSAELSASIATKLRRFDLDADAAHVHADAFERADRLFHSVLERMQRKSGIEPDAITFNIMITMYCLLDRWEMVHRVVRSANDQEALTIDCINNVLWMWLVRGPASANALEGNQDHEASAMDSALEVYRQLRQNLLYAELASQHSSIAYGKRGMTTHGTQDQNQDGATSQDDLGPLAWPDRDELPSDRSSLNSTMATKSDAVQTVLGISSFPLEVVPDEITHALIINSLTREGRFADALSVFRDLVSTPARLSGNETKSKQIGVKPDQMEAEEERKMQPTLAIFDSFFRGFSRHGRPSTASAFDPQDPRNTTWELVMIPESSEAEEERATQQQQDGPHARQLQMWRIEAFEEIFDAFLNFEPDVSKVLGSRAKATHEGREAKRGRADHRVSTTYGWLTLDEKRRLDALRRAPSTNQLFWVLTAIRRVSHDHAKWSLAMWKKVVDKFGPQPATSLNKLEWIGFELDNRLRRVLDHLESRLTQEQDVDEPSSAEH